MSILHCMKILELPIVDSIRSVHWKSEKHINQYDKEMPGCLTDNIGDLIPPYWCFSADSNDASSGVLAPLAASLPSVFFMELRLWLYLMPIP